MDASAERVLNKIVQSIMAIEAEWEREEHEGENKNQEQREKESEDEETPRKVMRTDNSEDSAIRDFVKSMANPNTERYEHNLRLLQLIINPY